MDGDKVVHLSLREFTERLLPVPQELVSARFPPRKMAGITEAFAHMVENYKGRAWDNDRCLHPEDQLAIEFTQIVNKHIIRHAAERDASTSYGQREGVILPLAITATESTVTSGAADTPREDGTGYVMQVFPYKWEPRNAGDVVRLLDNEPKGVSHDADDEDEGESGTAGGSGDDDRRWSTAALFRREWKPYLERDQPNWAYQSAFVQFTAKGAHNDPFDFGGVASRADDEEIASDDVADNREQIRRQMQSCADNVALHQHRTGVFSLVIGPREFRVVRWDRSGVVASERVDYVRDARALVGVLLALVVADHEGMGYDATATRILEGSEDYERMDRVVDGRYWRGLVRPWAEGTSLPSTVPIQAHAGFVSDAASRPADANLDVYLVDDTEATATTRTRRVQKDGNFVFRYVLDYFRHSLRVARGHGFPRYKLAVGGDEFLVGAPLYYYPTHPGSPRGYVAFHKQSGRFVFLKDYWRPGGTATSEGDALRRLNEDGVGNVPTLVCHGVVDGELSRVSDRWMSSKDQRTKSENIHEDTRDTALEDKPRGIKRNWDDLEEPKPSMCRYVHYRIVLKEVCLPLTAVTSSRQLVSVVGDCIEGHYDATEKSKLIYHNISSESIVILPTLSENQDGDDHAPRVIWRGVLADWEFARAVPVGRHDASESALRLQRTPAAWRHMSVASLVDGASHITTTADELESFFHVVLHHTIRFFPHNVNATDFVNTTFVPDSANEQSNVLCPLNKEIIVAELGVLKLRGRKVVFYSDSDKSRERRNAPLNHLLSTMLRWLKARYDVLEYESTATAPSSPTSAPDVRGNLPSVKRPHVEPKSHASNDADATTSGWPSSAPTSESEGHAVRPSDKTYELASRVDDHAAVRELFEEVLRSMDWPGNDVVVDQWIR